MKYLNFPTNGLLLKMKFELFAENLSFHFKCFDCWPEKFKQRHIISFGKISGEAKDIDINSTHKWVKTALNMISDGYKEEDMLQMTQVYFINCFQIEFLSLKDKNMWNESPF